MTKDGCGEPCQKPHKSPVVRCHIDHRTNSVKSLIVMVVSTNCDGSKLGVTASIRSESPSCCLHKTLYISISVVIHEISNSSNTNVYIYVVN